MFRRAGVKRDARARRRWAEAHPWCMVCGIPAHLAPWPHLQCHHLARPVRSDEPPNWLMLCARRHDLAHGATVRVDGRELPRLTFAHLLWAKRRAGPSEHDPARLAELLHRAVPDPESVPEWFEREYLFWRPWEAGQSP